MSKHMYSICVVNCTLAVDKGVKNPQHKAIVNFV